MVKPFVQDLSSMGQPVRLASIAVKAWNRARKVLTPRPPFKVGDAVLGDDPFNGRHEGVVVLQQGDSVGVRTAHGVVFYDHRQLKQLD